MVRYPGRKGLVPAVCATAEILAMVEATAEVVAVSEPVPVDGVLWRPGQGADE